MNAGQPPAEGPPAPTAETAAEHARIALLNLRQHVPEPDADRSYRSEIRRFKEFVTTKRAMNILPAGNRFLTRESVDIFFAENVAHRRVTTATARRVVTALQWLANNVEYLGEEHAFKVDDSQRVKDSLRAQEQLYTIYISSLPSDPHDNLPTNMLTREESDRVIQTILGENRQNWMNMTLSWTGSEAMMLRNDSMRKFRFCDIHTNLTHSPQTEPGYDQEMLSLVYLPGPVHKDRQKKKRVVGSWRHRRFLSCFTSKVAATLFVRLYADAEINFYKGNNASDPMWYNYTLIDGWGSTSAASEAYCDILDHLGIEWEKVVHLRKAGTEFASSYGELLPEEIATMTKHVLQKNPSRLQTVYLTELYKPVLRVMSGFRKADTYDVPRTRIEIDTYCRAHDKQPVEFFFPRYNEWCAQRQGPNGDESKAAENFLDYTLPYLSKVLLQDGIYWIQKFPNHTVTRHLLHVLPADYPQWASLKRNWVRQQEEHLNPASLEVMNNAARNAFVTLSHRVESLDQRNQELEATVSNQLNQIQELHVQLVDLLRGNGDGGNGNNGGDNGGDNGGGGGGGNGGGNGGENGAGRENEQQQQQQPRQGQQPVAELRNIEYIPPFPTPLPKSFVELLHQHSAYGLREYHNVAKRHWPTNMQNAFSKRVYLFQKILEKAGRMQGGGGAAGVETRLLIAAEELDRERGNTKLPKYLQHLKRNDPSVRKRRRGQGN